MRAATPRSRDQASHAAQARNPKENIQSLQSRVQTWQRVGETCPPTPMLNLLRPLTLALVLPLLACGGNSAASESNPGTPSTPDPATPTNVPSTDDAGALSVTVQGQEWRAQDRIKNRGLHFATEQVLLMLESEWPDGGVPLSLSIDKFGHGPGSFDLIPRIRPADRENPSVARVLVDGGAHFPMLTSVEGTLELERFEARKDESGRYRIAAAEGSVEGTFRDDSGETQTISATFRFAPRP